MATVIEVHYSDYRGIENRISANNAVMALAAGSQLPDHSLISAEQAVVNASRSEIRARRRGGWT